MLCCTWGEGGAVAVQKNVNSDHEWTKIAAWKPDTGTAQVIDTIGAGDTFIAGMLFALAHYPYDWSINQKVAFSNELAGRKVLQDGFAGLGEKMRHSSTSQEE
jgi:ketohexokinase